MIIHKKLASEPHLMSLLEYKNKFSIENPKKNTEIFENNFFRWTSGNFYRTSYNDMGSRVSNSDKFIDIVYNRVQLRERMQQFQDTKVLSQALKTAHILAKDLLSQLGRV